MSVGRTFNTALATTSGTNGAPTSGIFGPGWTSSLRVANAGADWAALSDTGSVLTATASDQSTTDFGSVSTGVFAPTGQDADSGLQVTADLTRVGCRPATDSHVCYDLTDLNGNTTVFQTVQPSTSTPVGTLSTPVLYEMLQVIEPASLDTTSYSYNASGLLTQLVAPLPSSGAYLVRSSAASLRSCPLEWCECPQDGEGTVSEPGVGGSAHTGSLIASRRGGGTACRTSGISRHRVYGTAITALWACSSTLRRGDVAGRRRLCPGELSTSPGPSQRSFDPA